MRTIFFIALMGIAAPTFAVSVEEAYRLIPHRRTAFQVTSARMAAPDRAYLEAFFKAIDQAIVAKVSARKKTPVAEAYAPVWRAWKELNPPAAFAATQDKVRAAIVDQQAFLLAMERNQTGWDMNHPKVRSASGKLQGAYGDLMRMYPNEDGTNKRAFFDYLCALDFI
jgi:hypothetical protein